MRSPRGLYYGWVMLLALSFTQVTSWGILYYGFSVFLKPMGSDLHWSRATMTGAFSLALATSGVAGLFVGRWLDRHGPRLLMTVGSCTAALLLLALSMVRSIALFYLIWAAIGVAMAAIFYEPAFAAIATWFIRYRSRALTIITFIGGFASVIYIPLISWLVRTQGWRAAMVILAIVLAITTIPLHALILRRRPQDLGLLPDGGVAGNDPQSSVLSPQSPRTGFGCFEGRRCVSKKS
jgi:sugar phosphate permease